MFIPPDEAASQHYRDLWDQLRNGAFIAEKFRRIGKNGRKRFGQRHRNIAERASDCRGDTRGYGSVAENALKLGSPCGLIRPRTGAKLADTADVDFEAARLDLAVAAVDLANRVRAAQYRPNGLRTLPNRPLDAAYLGAMRLDIEPILSTSSRSFPRARS